jgi:hypothetical protein
METTRPSILSQLLGKCRLVPWVWSLQSFSRLFSEHGSYPAYFQVTLFEEYDIHQASPLGYLELSLTVQAVSEHSCSRLVSAKEKNKQKN